jgi:hypothetical protein
MCGDISNKRAAALANCAAPSNSLPSAAGDPDVLISDVRYISLSCIGGAAVRTNRVCRVVALLVLFGACGAAGAAADEMTVAPSAFITAPSGPFQWAGFYVGANGGYGWSNSSVTYSPNDAASQAGTCGGVGRGKCIPDGGFQTAARWPAASWDTIGSSTRCGWPA